MALFFSYGPGLMTNTALDLLEDSITVNYTAATQDPLLEIRTFEHKLLASGWLVRLDFLALGLIHCEFEGTITLAVYST